MGVFPKIWSQSIICLLFKPGSKNNPGNYRGISITTTMYTIFSSIINNRLCYWSEEHYKIDEAQSGFRRIYSTADNIYSLHAVIQKYLSKQGGRCYCLYVDFRKYFNKINHYSCLNVLEI